MNTDELKKLIEAEGDYREFTFAGFTCVVKRHASLLTLNGYVLVGTEHPWFEVGYDDINAKVHGGITYSEYFEGLWSIGFDTAHYGDLNPSIRFITAKENQGDIPLSSGFDKYRDMDYVIAETKSLASQARQAVIEDCHA